MYEPIFVFVRTTNHCWNVSLFHLTHTVLLLGKGFLKSLHNLCSCPSGYNRQTSSLATVLNVIKRKILSLFYDNKSCSPWTFKFCFNYWGIDFWFTSFLQFIAVLGHYNLLCFNFNFMYFYRFRRQLWNDMKKKTMISWIPDIIF